MWASVARSGFTSYGYTAWIEDREVNESAILSGENWRSAPMLDRDDVFDAIRAHEVEVMRRSAIDSPQGKPPANWDTPIELTERQQGYNEGFADAIKHFKGPKPGTLTTGDLKAEGGCGEIPGVRESAGSHERKWTIRQMTKAECDIAMAAIRQPEPVIGNDDDCCNGEAEHTSDCPSQTAQPVSAAGKCCCNPWYKCILHGGPEWLNLEKPEKPEQPDETPQSKCASYSFRPEDGAIVLHVPDRALELAKRIAKRYCPIGQMNLWWIADQIQAVIEQIETPLPARESGSFNARCEIERLRNDMERCRLALTPSSVTKAALIGEFKYEEERPDGDGGYFTVKHTVPWTTIKEIMVAITKLALIKTDIEAERS